ncbi:TRAP transporter large permease [Halomonas cerina]|uniref:TRAP transporter large permease protein n=1 Tax=Halomonas cerina TaxID=447424 RepID=A0A839V906_9GAMM|nr:TRAP transporter large permease [Halomonas cerina]MBB3191922.1 tripartite ATP-independent transporter DctM subunit [Halomonas cerina]
MDNNLITLLGFVGLFGMIAMRVPVGIAMGIVGVLGFAALTSFDVALGMLATSPLHTVTNYNLSLIPMFILMGVFASATGMSRELFRAGQAWLGGFRGGAAMSTMAACGGFAAICGSSVATAATMTRVALPEMRRSGYADSLSTGLIASGGTLGILIPPSVVLVLYGFLTDQDIGKLFVAGVIPGLLAILLSFVTIQVLGILRPESMPEGARYSWRDKLVSLRGIWAVLLLFIAIVGGIYLGVVTPVEAAALGAFCTFLIGVLRGRLTVRMTVSCLIDALRTSVAIFTILIGAMLFSYFLTVTQTPQLLTEWLTSLPVGRFGVLLIILCLFLVLGCVLDPMAMIILMVPILYPVITSLGFDPIWFGIIVVVAVELGMITPPIGINVFVIRSVAPDVPLGRMFKGVMPFVAADTVRLALLVLFPTLVLFLPGKM